MGANQSNPHDENNQEFQQIIENQQRIISQQNRKINNLKKVKKPEENIPQHIKKEVRKDVRKEVRKEVPNVEYQKPVNPTNQDRFLDDVNMRSSHNIPKMDFSNSQQEMFQDFIKKQDKVKDFFQKKQKERKVDFYDELKDFGDKFNPYKILCLENESTSLDDIKTNYRLLSKKYHPDRKNGDTKKFQLITKAYTYLMNKHNNFTYREQTYEEINESLSNFMNKQKMYQNKFIDKDNFSLNKFNEIFEQYQVEEENDGYGDIMNKSNRMEEPDTINIKKNSMFNKNFNVNIFNNEFSNEKNSNPENQQLIIYEEPEAILSNMSINAGNLDGNRMDDYTDSKYTDYKKAHTVHNNLINAKSIKYKQYKNVDELKNERTNMRTTMTDEEKQKTFDKNNLEQEKEEKRLQKIRDLDSKGIQQFHKLNRKMINN
jgi:curved DNA-binding protein CbpA